MSGLPTFAERKKRRRQTDTVGDAQHGQKRARTLEDIPQVEGVIEVSSKPKTVHKRTKPGNHVDNASRKGSHNTVIAAPLSNGINRETRNGVSVSSREVTTVTTNGKDKRTHSRKAVASNEPGTSESAENGTAKSKPTSFQRLIATKWMTTKELKKFEDEQDSKYKRGPFNNAERAAIDIALTTFAKENRISREDAIGFMFMKKTDLRSEYKELWYDLATSVPGRPLVAVYNFCKRAYNPLGKQGAWTAEEDQTLLKAIDEYGQLWEKVSTVVGRAGIDCRDRYRNHLQGAENHNRGAWSHEEERKLVSIIAGLTIDEDEEGDEKEKEVFWEEVVRQMGGTRTKAQIRTKWLDSMRPLIKAERNRRWLPLDSYILLNKLNSMYLEDDKGLDWKLLRDEEWNCFSAHVMQRQWVAMKKSVDGWESMSFQDLLTVLLEKKSLSSEEIEQQMKKAFGRQADDESNTEEPTRPAPKTLRSQSSRRPITSKEFIDDSDEVDEVGEDER